MVNQAVVECYATLVDPFGSTAGRPSPHRGADYRRGAGQTVVAYEECTVVDSDLYSSFLGYCLTARRTRDGKYIGWAHLRVGTRPGNGTVLQPGDQVGLVAGYGENPGSSWSGPHIHTTEGDTPGHIYAGQNTDPAPDIAAARAGTAGGGGGGGTGVVNYGWWQLTAEAQGAIQRLLNHVKIYDGVDGGTGPEDNELGKRGIRGMQELMKRWGYLPGDYDVDGIPHNPDQNAPSNYGFALQNWAKAEAGYDGDIDGLPGVYTSGFIVKAVDKIISGVTPTPPTQPDPAPDNVPAFPPCPEGFFFFPDLGTSQSTFDFAEYNVKGGTVTALKMGGGNAGDSPYTAPAYKDQLVRAQAQNLKIIVYWFNGRKNGLTPESSMDYFAVHSDFKPGMVVAFDVEREDATDTDPWTPAECVRAIKQLRTHYPGINGLLYMSDSLADAEEWDEVVDLGWELWNASWGDNDGDPNVPPVTDDWPYHLAWQYTSKEKVPGNYRMVDGKKVYGDTDGNIARADLFAKLAWVLPEPGPDPEPEPEPDDDTRQIVAEYLTEAASLATKYAEALN